MDILFQEALYRIFTFAMKTCSTDNSVAVQLEKKYAQEQHSQNAFYFGPNYRTSNILNKNYPPPPPSPKNIFILSVNPSLD